MPAFPTTPKGLATRTQILAAARLVFAGSGYVGARMSDVADEAKVSLGGLYRYFADKEDLFAALVADLSDDLYAASRAPRHDFAADPRGALYEANRGYLEHYHAHRDVMRAFVESATVEPRFRSLWWRIRDRHVDRFVHVLARTYPHHELDGKDARHAAEAMACLVEQSAYVWFAQEDLRGDPVDVDAAATTVTQAWHRTFFGTTRGPRPALEPETGAGH